MAQTKLSGLNPLQTASLAEMGIPTVEVTRTTATFDGEPAEALVEFDRARWKWNGPGRGHPFQSSSSVRRKLVRGEGDQHVTVTR